MLTRWIASGAVLCALSVIAGAFGAHALEKRLPVEALALWETAARYLMYCALGLILVGLAGSGLSHRTLTMAAWFLLVGGAVFSGTVAILALGGPRWLGAVTPLGGLGMILGFLFFAWAAWQG